MTTIDVYLLERRRLALEVAVDQLTCAQTRELEDADGQRRRGTVPSALAGRRRPHSAHEPRQWPER